MIRYYSASRPQTPWTYALDVALIASFVLAFPAAWIANLMVSKDALEIVVSGQILQQFEKRVLAILMMQTSRNSPPSNWREAAPIGNFTIEIADTFHGWPLTTMITRRPANMTLDMRGVGVRTNVAYQADDPLHAAILRALQRDERHDVIAAWAAGDETAQERKLVRHQRVAWFVSAGIWWLILMFTAALTIHLTHLIAIFIKGNQMVRRAKLRAEGKCHTCGYDMTGLEFNERCPECGELVW